jgi:hypothetical protein
LAITHFIIGTHQSLANEFPTTRYGAYHWFFLYQGKYNATELSADDQMQQGLKHAREWKKRRLQEQNSQNKS